MADDLLIASAIRASDLLIRSVPMMILGVFAAELLVALNITGRLATVTRPLTSFSHLCDECGSAFMLAFISSSAANAMLVDYFHQGIIDRRELILSSLINSFPAVVMHWRILLPVYIPLLGLAGAIYFLLLTVVGFVKTFVVMVAARLLLQDGTAGEDPPVEAAKPKVDREFMRDVWHSAQKPLRRILVITVPTIILVALLLELGLFDWFAARMEGISVLFPVPVGGIGIIAAQFASYIAAASVASPLYFGGAISTRDLVITLLIGNVLSSVTRTIRWFGPGYVSIFGPRIGSEIVVISTCLRNGIMIALIFVLAWLW